MPDFKAKFEHMRNVVEGREQAREVAMTTNQRPRRRRLSSLHNLPPLKTDERTDWMAQHERRTGQT